MSKANKDIVRLLVVSFIAIAIMIGIMIHSDNTWFVMHSGVFDKTGSITTLQRGKEDLLYFEDGAIMILPPTVTVAFQKGDKIVVRENLTGAVVIEKLQPEENK